MFVFFGWFLIVLTIFGIILIFILVLTKINLHINFNGLDNNIYITYLGFFKYTIYQNGTKKNWSFYKHKFKEILNKKDHQNTKIKSRQNDCDAGEVDAKAKAGVEGDDDDSKFNKRIDTVKNTMDFIKDNKNISVIFKDFITHTSIRVNVKYTFFYKDPHITALFYGIINSLKFNLDFLLCKNFYRKKTEILIFPDFEKGKNDIDICIKLSIKLVYISVFMLKMVPIILKYKKMKTKIKKAV